MNVYLVVVNWNVPYEDSGYVIHSIWLLPDPAIEIAKGIELSGDDDSIEVQEWRTDEVMVDEPKIVYQRMR